MTFLTSSPLLVPFALFSLFDELQSFQACSYLWTEVFLRTSAIPLSLMSISAAMFMDTLLASLTCSFVFSLVPS